MKRRRDVMIKVCGVSKSFSEVKVLNDVSFTVDKGDIYGVIGHSGAGKSTLLRRSEEHTSELQSQP